MTVDDGRDDLLASVASLRTYDVSERRARHLRRRCHAALTTQSGPKGSAGMVNGILLRRVIGPALGGAWCLAYLVEIVRRAAAIYGLPR
jgi:hypothetical protein